MQDHISTVNVYWVSSMTAKLEDMKQMDLQELSVHLQGQMLASWVP